MKINFLHLSIALFIIFICICNAAAHCEIPCGIYGDKARINLISEHIATLEKSMKMIRRLQETKPINHNQLTRWIINKEKHATEIQVIVSQYFMTQRIKPDSENYLNKLELLHQMLLKAMHCKQTIDADNTRSLRDLLNRFEGLYFHGTAK